MNATHFTSEDGEKEEYTFTCTVGKCMGYRDTCSHVKNSQSYCCAPSRNHDAQNWPQRWRIKAEHGRRVLYSLNQFHASKGNQ